MMMKCSRCKASKDASRLPPGWKNFQDDIWCQKCWRSAYVLRAITIPVVSPLNGTWGDLRTDLSSMWGLTTQASNWMMTELYAGDCRRNGEPKMPRMERTYLYPAAVLRFPALPPQTVSSLEQSTTKKYRKLRYETIWTCARSLPVFRYPVPFPVHNQSWKPEIEDKSPVVDVRIADKRWKLRLKGGARFRRQMAAFRQMVDGEGPIGELALYRRTDHDTGRSDILCKMVAWFPRRDRKETLSGTLYVRTDHDALLVALNAKDEKLWSLAADHLPRWTAEHAKQLKRWSDDTKAEQRPKPSFAQRRKNAVEKYHHRMDSVCHEAAAQLVNYAIRRRFAKLQYADSIQDFCTQFQYFKLRALISEKCDAAGIAFDHASTDAAAKTAGVLAKEESHDN